jgi:hypothetical protein
MKIEYKFVNAALIGIDLQHGKIYEHPTIHSIYMSKDEYENDVLTVTLIVLTEYI